MYEEVDTCMRRWIHVTRNPPKTYYGALIFGAPSTKKQFSKVSALVYLLNKATIEL
jgi:hypothetical protein